MEHKMQSIRALRGVADAHARGERMWREIAALLFVAAFFQAVLIALFLFGRL